MCEFLIFKTRKRYEKQKNFGNFSATFWQLLDTFIGNIFGIHRQLVTKPTMGVEDVIFRVIGLQKLEIDQNKAKFSQIS